MQGYWGQYLNKRVSRRRALGATGGFVSAAALLAACSGEDEEPASPPTSSGSGGSGGGSGSGSTGGSESQSSGLLYTPVDSTANAKPGGTFKDAQGQLFEHLDPLLSSAAGPGFIGAWCHSRLTKYVPGHLEEATYEIEGDVLEAFEVNGDGLQVTLKVRPNAKWDERAPTSGRAVDAEDIAWSWSKFVANHNARGDYAHEANPDAVIESITATDSQTAIMRLTRPDAGILQDLAATARFVVQPREAESEYDPRTEVRGSGAWFVENYTPSVGITYHRNPNWYMADRPLIDVWESPIVQEYSARLAQFRAGNIYSTVVNQADILSVKNDEPDLLLTQQFAWPTSIWGWYFGWREGSIYEDDRVRKALNMALDRGALLTAFSNSEQFTSAGLEVPTRWHSTLPGGLTGWWLDPQGSELGEGAAYFQYNPEEAKKLLAAANHPDGFDDVLTTSNISTFVNAQPEMQVHMDMFREIGARYEMNVVDHVAEFRPRYYFEPNGDFEGIAVATDGAGYSRETFLHAFLVPGGGRFRGFHAPGHKRNGDPEVTSMVNEIRSEFDAGRRTELAHELQRHLARQMYYIPWPGVFLGFDLAWPVIGNYGVFREQNEGGAPQETHIHRWIDETKAPIA